jgi:MoxR-like ATPase
MEENTSTLDIRAINEKIERESAFIDLLTMEMNKVIVGQKHMVERLLIGLLGQGHILLEGVPGLAKTLRFLKLLQVRLAESNLHLIYYLPMWWER